MTRHRQPWIAVTALTIVSWSVTATPSAEDPTDSTSAVLATAEEDVVPEEFEYVWSEAAELIVHGTVAAIAAVDDPSARGAYVEATIRVDSVQRGEPKSGTLRVRGEDQLQAALWRERETAIGSSGLWFVHRVSNPNAGLPVGHLLSYMSSVEIGEDPALAERLMRYAPVTFIHNKMAEFTDHVIHHPFSNQTLNEGYIHHACRLLLAAADSSDGFHGQPKKRG